MTCSEKDPATIGGAIIDASSPEDSAKNCLGKLLENIDNLEGRATTLKRRVPSPYWGSPAARKGTPSSFISPFHTKAASTSGATITNKKEKPRTNGFHAPGQPFKDLRKNYSWTINSFVRSFILQSSKLILNFLRNLNIYSSSFYNSTRPFKCYYLPTAARRMRISSSRLHESYSTEDSIRIDNK